MPGRLQCFAPPRQVIEHGLAASHQIFVIIQSMPLPLSQDAEEWLHRDVHFVPDRPFCQFDDHAEQGLDRAGSAAPAITDEGDGLALPLVQRAVERILENRCGTVIVLGTSPRSRSSGLYWARNQRYWPSLRRIRRSCSNAAPRAIAASPSSRNLSVSSG